MAFSVVKLLFLSNLILGSIMCTLVLIVYDDFLSKVFTVFLFLAAYVLCLLVFGTGSCGSSTLPRPGTIPDHLHWSGIVPGPE